MSDLMIACGTPPAKLKAALDVIGLYMIPLYKMTPDLRPGAEKDSCILMSLIVRDFLRAVGIKAKVRSVTAVIKATDKDGKEIWSVGIGSGEAEPEPGRWDGHLVVEADGWLIDPTIGQARRKYWADLPSMIAMPLYKELDSIAGGTATVDGTRIDLMWFPRKDESWRTAPDAGSDRRKWVVDALVSRHAARRDLAA